MSSFGERGRVKTKPGSTIVFVTPSGTDRRLAWLSSGSSPGFGVLGGLANVALRKNPVPAQNPGYVIDLPHILLGFALGALFGAVGGLFGIGGGLVAIPVLGVFFHLDEQHAQGTAMVMIAPNVILGLVNYARRGGMDRRIAITLALSAIPLTFVGAQIATHVPSTPLRRSFALFLASIAIYFVIRIVQTKRGDVPVATGRGWPWSALVGGIGGMVSGLFSIGGAIFAVPTLAMIYGLSQATAQGLGLAMVAPGTLVALGTYAWAHDVDWALAIPLAAGGTIFVSRGVALAHRLPERVLRALFVALCLTSSIALWTHA